MRDKYIKYDNHTSFRDERLPSKLIVNQRKSTVILRRIR